MQKFKKGQSLYVEKKKDKIAMMHDPYLMAWDMKSKGKLIEETVGHLPKELSWGSRLFLERGGKISGNVFEEKYQPSWIPKGGLEMMLEAKLKIEDKKKKNSWKLSGYYWNK